MPLDISGTVSPPRLPFAVSPTRAPTLTIALPPVSPGQPVASRSSSGKLGTAIPRCGIAEDDCRKHPPRSSELSHSNAPTLLSDLSTTVSNNLDVIIDGPDATALVDTGADYNVLSGKLSRRLQKDTTRWDGPQIRTAGEHLSRLWRGVQLASIHGETCPVQFVVLQDCARDIILGMNFLCEYGAVINLGANRLKLRKPALLPEEPKARSNVLVPVMRDVVTCGKFLLEGNVQLLLERRIGVARGVTEL